MCQEVGHTLGLDHQDENFDNPNLGTCMDYTSDPGTNQHPNQHDYDELEAIYAHLDTTTTVGSAAPASGQLQRVRDDLWVQDARQRPPDLHVRLLGHEGPARRAADGLAG